MTDNNVLRPPLLGNNSGTPLVNNAHNSAQNNISLADLSAAISQIVATEINKALNSGNQNNVEDADEIVDQTDTSGMDKIPDIVKSIKDFSGEHGQFSSWKKSVDRILIVYEDIKGSSKYYGILNTIRNKIIGEADIILESYNTPLNWGSISKCLSAHYADKRDLGTLEYQMTILIQKNESIDEFYHKVYQHLSLILNKLGSMDLGNEALSVMTTSYRNKALDTFVRGLKGDLPRLLSIKEPENLPQALYLCQKLKNVDYRIQHSHGNIGFQKPPQLPPKRIQTHQNNYSNNQNNFFPELAHNPGNVSKPNFTNFKTKANPNYQNPNQNYQQNPNFRVNKPEPMEVDNSIRTNRVNYQNRPINNKRPLSAQTNPNKNQKLFNIEDQIEEIQNEEINEEIEDELLEEVNEDDANDNENYFLEL